MKIFVNGINWNATENDIKILFSQFGPVDDVRLIYYPTEPPKRRGFVFVEMLESENAMKAIISLDGKEFQGRIIHCEKAMSRDEFLAKRKANGPDDRAES